MQVCILNLNRLCGLLDEFAEMQNRLDKHRTEKKQELAEREATLQRVHPSGRNALLREMTDWKRMQSSELQQFAVQQRESLLVKIKQATREIAQARGVDLVIDSGEVSLVGFPVVLFAREELDLTEEIALVMNGGDSGQAAPDRTSFA